MTVLLILLSVSSGQCQKNTLVAGVDYNISTGWGQYLQQANIHAGFGLKDRYFFEYHFGINKLLDNANVPRNLHYYSNSISAKVRFFKPDRRVSPILHLDAGFGYGFNGDKTYILGSHTISGDSTASTFPIGTPERVISYGSVRLAADGYWNSIHFQLGGGFHYGYLSVNRFQQPEKELLLYRRGWILSASVSYVLNFKK